MTDREAMKMALDALEDSMYPQKKQFDAIVGLKQALAQPEQTKCPRCGEVNPAEIHTCSPQVAQPEFDTPESHIVKWSIPVDPNNFGEPLAQPEQDEGVDGSVRIYIKRNGTFERVDTVEKALELSREMHTAPPKREWVGLTNKEVDAIRNNIFEKYKKALFVTRDVTSENDYSAFNFYRAIEEKLRIKND